MWEIKFSQTRTSEFFSSMWWITRIFREVKACLLKSNCHTNVVISQVSQIYIAVLIWFPALYFQCHFESVTFHWVYQGKARMVFKLKKTNKKGFQFWKYLEEAVFELPWEWSAKGFLFHFLLLTAQANEQEDLYQSTNLLILGFFPKKGLSSPDSFDADWSAEWDP